MPKRKANKRPEAEPETGPEPSEPVPQMEANDARAKKRQKRDEYRAAAAGSAQEVELPRKKFYRQRAHANPFSDHQLDYPVSPQAMDWTQHYPAFRAAGTPAGPAKRVEVLDIGCGFGGLLFALAPLLPDTLILGMEIRLSVTDFVTAKIRALRASSSAASSAGDAAAPPGGFANVSAVRANAMKFLPNFFARAQLGRLFLCFPDPHFKARKHKARIVSAALCAEYAFVLRPGGLVYAITDVEDLHAWMCRHFDASASFARVGEAEAAAAGGAACVAAMRADTEEGKKVARHGGHKFVAFWRRVADPAWPGE